MSFRSLMLATSAAAVLATPVYAQVPEPASAEDEVVVTGSRIAADPETTAANPVVAIDGADLLDTGRIDIGQTLREVPALQGSAPGALSALQAADTDDADLGLSLLNLRNLGVERTLVLQNGRRHVPGTAGQAAVDVTAIPALLIERSEVLTGGASSIYGADAVSGVVNFVLRDARSFDGIEANIRGGVSGEGDAEEVFIGAATGLGFFEDRGRLVVAGEYAKSEEIFGFDRDFAGSGLFGQVPNTPALAAQLGINPNAANTYLPNITLPISSAGGVIALGEAGTFPSAFVGVAGNAPGPYPTIGSNGISTIQYFDGTNLRAYNAGDIFIDAFNASGGDAVPTTPDVELLLPDTERYSINALGELDLNDKVTAFFEAKYVNSKSIDSIQVNGFNDDLPIALDNPFIPAQLRAQLDSLIAEGITPEIAVSRDVLDDGARPLVEADRDTVRLVVGFKGDLSDTFGYEISYNYGETTADITNGNTRLEDRFFAALDAVVDPATGNIVCRSSLDPSAIPPVSPFPFYGGDPFATFQAGDGQCQPINIFGPNSIDEAGRDFAFVDTFDRTEARQESVLALVSGDTSDFLNLPAGPLGVAVGFEWREEFTSFTPDPRDTAGLTFGSVSGGPTSPASGEISVYEVFGEVRVPLLADMPFAELLEVSASGRYSDYNTSGGTETYSLSARYQPVEALTLRGTYAEAIRAPNIGELFNPQQPATLGATADPCNPQFIGAGTQFREANCLALVGAGFNSADFNSAFVSGVSGGNPNLNPEEAETYTLGAVLNGSSLGGFFEPFVATVDYYNISIDGAIAALGAFAIASNCVDLPDLNNPFCDQIVRGPNGNIVDFASGQVNLGALETEGVDFAIRYGFDLPNEYGELDLGFAGTYFIDRIITPDSAQPTTVSREIGTFGEPEWILTGSANYSWSDLSLGWTVRYESDQLLPGISNEDIESNPDFADPFNTGDSFVHDFDVGYRVNDNLSVYGGVLNVADRAPYLSSLVRPVGPRGRFFFAGVRVNY
ncbi:MAG: TonB-dependent receptor [Litorimonas sp.]